MRATAAKLEALEAEVAAMEPPLAGLKEIAADDWIADVEAALASVRAEVVALREARLARVRLAATNRADARRYSAAEEKAEAALDAAIQRGAEREAAVKRANE